MFPSHPARFAVFSGLHQALHPHPSLPASLRRDRIGVVMMACDFGHVSDGLVLGDVQTPEIANICFVFKQIFNPSMLPWEPGQG